MKHTFPSLKDVIRFLGHNEVVCLSTVNGGFQAEALRKVASPDCLALCREIQKNGAQVMRVVKKTPGDICEKCGHSEGCPKFPEGTL